MASKNQFRVPQVAGRYFFTDVVDVMEVMDMDVEGGQQPMLSET